MSWRSRRMNRGRCMETKMELFTFALVIWVIYLGLALWPESEKSHRGENGAKELGEKATARTLPSARLRQFLLRLWPCQRACTDR